MKAPTDNKNKAGPQGGSQRQGHYRLLLSQVSRLLFSHLGRPRPKKWR